MQCNSNFGLFQSGTECVSIRSVLPIPNGSRTELWKGNVLLTKTQKSTIWQVCVCAIGKGTAGINHFAYLANNFHWSREVKGFLAFFFL